MQIRQQYNSTRTTCTKEMELTQLLIVTNNNFEESRMRQSASHKGKPTWNKGMSGADYTKHFKNGIKNQFTSTKEG